jgi:hypothetical protein
MIIMGKARQVQEFYAVVEVHWDAIPEKSRIFIDNIGWRGISELSVHSNLFKFGIKRVRLPWVHGIAKLPYEIRSLD